MAQSLDSLHKDTPIEILRLHVEMSKVEASKNEMLLQVREKEADIERLMKNILIQEKRINELADFIKKGDVK